MEDRRSWGEPLLRRATLLPITDPALNFFACDDRSPVAENDVSLSELCGHRPSHIDFRWVPQKTMVDTFFTALLANYTAAYTTYLLLLISAGAIVFNVWCGLDAVAAIFMACSSVTQAGLAVVSFAELSFSTHLAALVLMILGSPLLLTLVPVVIRRFAFASFRRWCLCEGKLPPSDMEDGILRLLCCIVFGYWVAMEVLGVLLAIPVDWSRVDGRSWLWNSVFMTSSAVQNNGLALTPDSLEPLAENQYVLYLISVLIVLGNVGAPICLRCITVCLVRFTPAEGEMSGKLKLLLARPRHFYTIFSQPLTLSGFHSCCSS